MSLFSRREPAELTIFDPRDSVLGAVRLMTNQLQAFGIELERELPVRCQTVAGRPLQVEQVVLNLLSNARDAVLERTRRSRSKGIDYIPNIRITVLDDRTAGRVRIVVQDNGYGVAEAIKNQIFEPFFTTKPAGEGTGLGLSVSYRLIAEIGGALALADSAEGARFEISLPGTMMPLEKGPAPAPKPAQTTLMATSAVFSRILVVDDESLLAQALADYLRQQGYETVIASNGLEALENYKCQQIDVVITDLWMPIMSGNELIARLHELNPVLPIIAVTGHAPLASEEERAGDGASLLLKKPIQLRAIKEALIFLQNRLGKQA
jgi:CheY-like chemotaxis protein